MSFNSSRFARFLSVASTLALLAIPMVWFWDAFAATKSSQATRPGDSDGKIVRADALAVIVPKSAALNFGTVWDNPKFSWQLPLTNRTAKALDLQLSAGCSCTSIVPASLRIEPQATRTVTLQIDTRSRLNRQPELRSFSTMIRSVATHQGVQVASEQWELTGTIKIPLRVTPQSIEINRSLSEEVPSQADSVAVECLHGCTGFVPDFDPTQLVASVTRQSAASSDGDPGFLLNLQPSSKLLPGKYAVSLSLRPTFAGSESAPELPIRVVVNISGRYYSVPEPADLGLLAIGRSHTKKFMIKSRSGKPFRLLSIVTKTADVAASADFPVPSARPIDEALLTVRCSPEKAGPQAGQLALELESADERSRKETLVISLPYEAVR